MIDTFSPFPGKGGDNPVVLPPERLHPTLFQFRQLPKGIKLLKEIGRSLEAGQVDLA
jgi:hypothetical protein